jgi:hypothetical protein
VTIAGRLAEPPDNERDELRRALLRTQRQLASAKAKSADLVDAVYQAARDAAVTIGRPATPTVTKAKSKRRGEVALVHATDWQVGKSTPTYNTDIAAERIGRFASKVAAITDIMRSAHPVRDCHLMLGGDMVEGVTIFPGQPFEVDSTLYTQLFSTVRIIDQLVHDLLATFETVTVWEEYGNHGRIGRRGDVPGGDNIDRIAYAIARERYATERRVTWHPAHSWYEIVAIGNYRALLVHGDEIKSFGGNVPAFGILRKCNAWASGAIPEQFHDAYLGHFHTPMSLTMANAGRAFVTGSPESGNAYAQEFCAATGIPSQRLHFVDPDKGRVTSEHLVWLDE